MACYIEQVRPWHLLDFKEMTTLLVVSFFALSFASTFASGPVTRVRLERFAGRQRLEITPTNGDQVIAYLATTRRWRVAGLVTGLLTSAVWAQLHAGVTVNFLS